MNRIISAVLTVIATVSLGSGSAYAASPIDERYEQLDHILGNPQGQHYEVTGKFGSYIANARDYQNGTIWSIGTKAYWLNSALNEEWQSWAGDEMYVPEGDQYNVTNGKAVDTDNGSIYWSTSTGAHVVFDKQHGIDLAIDEKYNSLGGPNGFLGLPTKDLEYYYDGAPIGLGQRFKWGMIFQKGEESNVAHEVHGAILSRYFSEGGAKGHLGFPTSDEQATSGGRISHFENGSIKWVSATGKTVVLP